MMGKHDSKALTAEFAVFDLVRLQHMLSSTLLTVKKPGHENIRHIPAKEPNHEPVPQCLTRKCCKDFAAASAFRTDESRRQLSATKCFTRRV